MTKIPSKKFSTAKRKIASTKFSTVKRKLPSSQFSNQTAKIPSRKFAKAKKATSQNQDVDAPLDHPADEQARQDVVATLKLRTVALKKKAKTKTAR
ncbi:hypothetical protein LBMAG52_01530 [Planctomycetia bacterium]|nr:hypothetical protein LBMAG52_01530 [Planctomycetia bacterium]